MSTPLPSPMPEAVFEARGLTKVYRSGEVVVRALAEVDLTLYGGDLMVLLGSSGSGKSTFSIFWEGWTARPPVSPASAIAT